ncbi:MAG: hypothetical protein A3J74_07520 [Elusimicrobia bacterium RIFCSPHIGHO2_02_FULL_57_9]|nr:MAG: hypothetical protein A3J74_07520 [Elusimicrobia bacterium RIFCSPHIGHO2_02_FULL_57_9]
MKLWLAAALALRPLQVSAGLLTAQGAAVLDQSAAARGSFTNNEKIVLQQRINNGSASANRIVFQFLILSPGGAQVFSHVGNAVPGSAGNAASQLSGVPVSQFYVGPGVYTLKARAGLDGVTLEQTVAFTISSPNILLIYPPNGAANLSDNPLTFQWISSGASNYRVTVGDNVSLYNSLYTQNTAGGETTLSYPQNPSDPRQRLTSGQLYYWKVEGLDVNGNVVAQSQVPFSFSMRSVSLTRDLAVPTLEISGPPAADGSIPFRIVAANQGSTSESAVPLKFSVGGLPAAGTPLALPLLNPGDRREYSFPAAVPADQKQSLAIACVELFDDNVVNNCKTLSVSKPASSGLSGDAFQSANLSAEQIWLAIRELLKERDISLEDYRLVGMEGSLSRDELAALLESLRRNQARATLTGPSPSLPLAPVVSAPAKSVPIAVPIGASKPPALENVPAAEDELQGQQWSGLALPLADQRVTFTVLDKNLWKRLWSRLADQRKLPSIDFRKFMVVGVIASRKDRVDNIEIEQTVISTSGLIVRYRMVVHRRMLAVGGPKNIGMGNRAPYLLKVIARSEVKVKFEEIEEIKEKLDE